MNLQESIKHYWDKMDLGYWKYLITKDFDVWKIRGHQAYSDISIGMSYPIYPTMKYFYNTNKRIWAFHNNLEYIGNLMPYMKIEEDLDITPNTIFLTQDTWIILKNIIPCPTNLQEIEKYIQEIKNLPVNL